MNMSATPAMLVVGVGEALYDILATGDVFGGAPVNFAVQARQLLDRGLRSRSADLPSGGRPRQRHKPRTPAARPQA